MRALRSISLRKNGIDERCAEEVEALLQIKRVARLDLASNEMGKSCLQFLCKNFGHLEWVEYILHILVFHATTSCSRPTRCRGS